MHAGEQVCMLLSRNTSSSTKQYTFQHSHCDSSNSSMCIQACRLHLKGLLQLYIAAVQHTATGPQHMMLPSLWVPLPCADC